MALSLNKAAERYEKIVDMLADAADALDELAGDMNDRLGEESEKWLESEAGQAFASAAEEIETHASNVREAADYSVCVDA